MIEFVKIGEYIRTKQNTIGRIIDINNKKIICDNSVWFCGDECLDCIIIDNDDPNYEQEDFIVDHSFDIKDILCDGDYVIYDYGTKDQKWIGRTLAKIYTSSENVLCVEGNKLNDEKVIIKKVLLKKIIEDNIYNI